MKTEQVRCAVTILNNYLQRTVEKEQVDGVTSLINDTNAKRG